MKGERREEKRNRKKDKETLKSNRKAIFLLEWIIARKKRKKMS
mgnify:CR=1 FL=1